MFSIRLVLKINLEASRVLPKKFLTSFLQKCKNERRRWLFNFRRVYNVVSDCNVTS